MVVEKKTSGDPYDRRYVVIDRDTGEVLDDAQGYGYKTAQNAHKAYGYKNPSKKKIREKKLKTRRIKQWMKEHPEFVEAMNTFAFEILKGSWGADAKFNAQFVKEMLEHNNLETDFSAVELLRGWREG